MRILFTRPRPKDGWFFAWRPVLAECKSGKVYLCWFTWVWRAYHQSSCGYDLPGWIYYKDIEAAHCYGHKEAKPRQKGNES